MTPNAGGEADVEPTTNAGGDQTCGRRWRRLFQKVLWGLGCGLIVFLVVPALLPETAAILEALARLGIGWSLFLGRVVPAIEFNTPLLASAIVAGGASVLLLHTAVRWLLGKVRGGRPVERAVDVDSPPWQARHTAALAALVIALFTASIGGAGIAHQVGWLVNQPIVNNESRGRITVQVNQLRQLLIAAKLYAEDHDGSYPATLDDLIGDEYIPADRWHRLVLIEQGDDGVPEPVSYHGGGRRDDESVPFIVFSAPRLLPPGGPGGRRIVAFSDGSARPIPEAEFQLRGQPLN